jgi:hypothetical protein
MSEERIKETTSKLTCTLRSLMITLPTDKTPLVIILIEKHILSKDFEMGFMRCESQHDQIGIESIQDMLDTINFFFFTWCIF